MTEILVAVTVLAVLAALAIPAVMSSIDQAQASKVLSNARTIGMANLLYAQDNYGKINGPGVRVTGETWNEFNTTRLVRYLTATQEQQPAWNTVKAVLNELNDPRIPESIVYIQPDFKFNWSFNGVFHIETGRAVQGLEKWSAATGENVNFRRMAEFQRPSEIIYAVSGTHNFNKKHIADETLVGTPEEKQAIYYLYKNNSTPAVFLDGHAEFVSFPIEESMVIPQP